MNCSLCSSNKIRFLSEVEDVEYWSSQDTFFYYECLSCELIFLKDPPFDKLSEIYPDSYYSTDFQIKSSSLINYFLNNVKTFLDKKFFRKTLSTIKHRQKLSCLDIGGGSGWMLNILRASDSRVNQTSVIDLNPKSKELAKKNGHTFYCQNVEAIDFNNLFDVVLLLNLIEHVANPKNVLKSIHSAMRPQALAIIKTPNNKSFNRRLFESKYWGGYHAPRHWNIFNEKNFRKMCEDVGFVVQKLSYTQGAHQWAASVLGSFFSSGRKKVNMYSRFSYSVLLIFFAIFDFMTLPFRSTDQFFVVLRKKDK